MNIVFAASECTPWAKTGGLADVVSGLPRALTKLGHKVSTFIPYYRQVAKVVPNPRVVIESVTIPFSYYNRFARILDGGNTQGAQMYFVDCPELFDRENFYATPSGDYPDNDDASAHSAALSSNLQRFSEFLISSTCTIGRRRWSRSFYGRSTTLIQYFAMFLPS